MPPALAVATVHPTPLIWLQSKSYDRADKYIHTSPESHKTDVETTVILP